MKYVQEGPFHDWRGEPLVLSTSEPFHVHVGWLLTLLLNQYRPSSELTLTSDEIRLYNRALRMLEAPPVDGSYAFEDTDFAVVQRVANHVMPQILIPQIMRSAPALEDLLASVA